MKARSRKLNSGCAPENAAVMTDLGGLHLAERIPGRHRCIGRQPNHLVAMDGRRVEGDVTAAMERMSAAHVVQNHLAGERHFPALRVASYPAARRNHRHLQTPAGAEKRDMTRKNLS